MILLKLHVENFGKLHNLDLDFNHSLNEIMKDNGWGKSTLTIFIKSMFYGMGAKTRGEQYKSQRTKFMSWQGGVYGGYIEYEIGGKKFRVTRTFGKSPEYDTFELFDFATNQTIKEENKVLGEQIFGIGEESFLMTAFFPQLNFKSTSNSELTANLTGVNKYQDDLENVDKAIKKLKDRRLEIKRLIPKKSEIEEKKVLLNQIQTRGKAISKEIEEKEDELNLAKEKKKQIDENVSLLKEKLSMQEDRYKSKLNIESKIRDLTGQVASLYERQSSIQDKTLTNLNSRQKDKFKIIFITFFVLLGLLAITTALLYAFNIIDLTFFVSIFSFSIIAMVVLVIFILIKKKKDKEINSKIDSSVSLAKNFKSQIDELNESLKHLDKILNENYKNVEMPKREEYDDIKNRQNSANLSIFSIENTLVNLRNEMENNISQEEYLASQIELLKDQLSTYTHKYDLIDKTIEYLLSARDNVATRYVSTINFDFFSILNKFGIDANRFVIDNKWSVKEQTNVGAKDFEYSSQGLQDIISFCQRISLINKIYKKEKPFVILDDTFVNLDDKMLECAKQVVKELAGEFQVIYICCHSRCSITN